MARTPHPPPRQKPDPPVAVKPKPPGLNATQQSIYADMKQMLVAWGLSSLVGDLKGLLMKGYQGSELTLHLRETNAYKVRFAGNEERIKNGLAALSEGDYLSTEAGYQQVLRAYGMPKGFYDQHSDFVNFIGGGVSVDELRSRVQVAHDQYTSAPDSMKSLWSQYFGKGDVLASILDPGVATQLILDRGTQVAIGGAAAAQGLHVDRLRAQQLQQAGLSGAQADQGYAQIAQSLPTDQQIATRFGTTFDQQDEEDDVLLGRGDAASKRQTLYGEEEALFRAGAGNTAQSIGTSQSY